MRDEIFYSVISQPLSEDEAARLEEELTRIITQKKTIVIEDTTTNKE